MTFYIKENNSLPHHPVMQRVHGKALNNRDTPLLASGDVEIPIGHRKTVCVHPFTQVIFHAVKAIG